MVGKKERTVEPEVPKLEEILKSRSLLLVAVIPSRVVYNTVGENIMKIVVEINRVLETRSLSAH